MLLVFIIDDHSDTRDSLALLLSMEGFDVMTFANFEQALNELDITVPELIIADARIPRSIPLEEFLSAAKRRAPETRILVNSADNRARTAAQRSGADGFLLKPDDVRTWLRVNGFHPGDRTDDDNDVHSAC